MGPRAGLDSVSCEEFPALSRTRTPDHPARSPALPGSEILGHNLKIHDGQILSNAYFTFIHRSKANLRSRESVVK
jgi:hypothetical protein